MWFKKLNFVSEESQKKADLNERVIFKAKPKNTETSEKTKNKEKSSKKEKKAAKEIKNKLSFVDDDE